MLLLSRLEVDTQPWLASVYMLVVGIGIGLVMQVLVLAVQNDAPARDVGRRDVHGARSSARWAGRSAWRCSARSSPRRLADELTALPPEVAGALRRRAQRSARRRCTPCRRSSATDFLLAFVDALQPVFVVGAALTAVAFALSWMLREVPLRATTHQATDLAAEEAIAGATGAEAIVAGRERRGEPPVALSRAGGSGSTPSPTCGGLERRHRGSVSGRPRALRAGRVGAFALLPKALSSYSRYGQATRQGSSPTNCARHACEDELDKARAERARPDARQAALTLLHRRSSRRRPRDPTAASAPCSIGAQRGAARRATRPARPRSGGSPPRWRPWR